MTKTIAILMLLLALVAVGCGAPAATAPTAAPAATSVPATEAPAATQVPPTATPVPATATSIPPTATPVPPTEAATVAPTIAPTVAPTTAPTVAAETPTAAPPAGGIPAIPHPIVGMEGQCLTCHGAGGQKPVPADHEGRTVDTCTTCHQPGDAQNGGGGATAGPRIPHPIAGMEGQCLTCHGPGGQKPVPADHASRTVDTCKTCHVPEN